MRVLVTGGAGFIGSHLCRHLQECGHTVVALDDLSMGTRERIPPGVTLVEADVADVGTVTAALRRHRCDAVCHLAARVSVRASTTAFVADAQTNVMGTLGVLEAVLATDVRRVVLASSMAVYADSPQRRPVTEAHPTAPLSPYGIGKLAAEQFTMNILGHAGREGVVLRLFNTYGPGQTFTPYVGVITIFARRLMHGEVPVIFGDGEQVRDFVFVGDVASAFAAAVERRSASGIYNIGSALGRSVNEIAALLQRHIAPALAASRAPQDPSELRYSVADISRATTELGYKPAGSLEQAMDSIIASVTRDVQAARR